MAAPRADTLFEVSWEVCNKVGGIHTVVRSKLPFIQKLYPNIVLIGPLSDAPSQEFEPRPAPKEWEDAFVALRTQGIECAYGVWATEGAPAVVLVRGLFDKKDSLKYLYWEKFGIDSLRSGWDFEEPLCFATAAGMAVEEYLKRNPSRAILHCHEWLAGFALLHCKAAGVRAGTVFTTHATMLGRSMMGNGHALYELLETLDPLAWAYTLGVQDKHLAEVACARHADAFTTVSEITGKEATKILGRQPDVLLYNGFSSVKFPTFEETSIRHSQSKETLRELTAYTFFPYYSFDIQKTLFFFTSGRYEFTNKGIDVLIDALGEVNEMMKRDGSEMTLVVLLWVLMGRSPLRQDVLESKNYFTHVKSYVGWQGKQIARQLLLDFLSGKQPGKDDAFTSQFIRELHAGIAPLRRSGLPPLSTHHVEEHQDPVLGACRSRGLLNRKEDRVKVLLYPGPLEGSDGLLNLDYYDATVGCHLGVFPSNYEPWGYTPLESAALGVPAVTTDLAGFGRFIEGCEVEKGKGIFVLKREGRSRDDVVSQLSSCLHGYLHSDHEERVQHGFLAKSLARRCDWKLFIPRYVEAHNLALERAGL